jgi:hypothetical protein
MAASGQRSGDMKILVTSASSASGDGYGQLLAFSMDGTAQGVFSNDLRIVDPRGLCVHANQQLLYVNSGDDRILELDGATFNTTQAISRA